MVIGRGDELARIEQLLAAARLGTSQVLVIAGEPGIGKTALLEYAIEHAGEMTVLRARGVESESEIPFAGLHALLRPALDRIDELPAAAGRGAQGRARARARHAQRPLPDRRRDAQPARADGRAAPAAGGRRRRPVGRRVLARRDPVRRPARVRRRARAADRDAARRRAPAGPDAIVLRGLDRETRPPRVLEHHAGKPLPPGVADRIFEATLGNPLALIELAATAECRRARAAVETSVEHAFAPRIAALPEPTRRLLALAAAEEAGELARCWSAPRGAGLDLAALAAAEQRRARQRRARPARVLPPARALGRLPLRAVRRAPRGAPRARARRARSRPARLASRRGGARPGRRGGATSSSRPARAPAPAVPTPPPPARSSAPPGSRPRRPSAPAGCSRPPTPPGSPATPSGPSSGWPRPASCATTPSLRLEIDHLRGHAALRAGRVRRRTTSSSRPPPRAPPDQAVEMLAEAAEACEYAADPGRMLRAAERAWEALTPDAGERARCFATSRSGWR